MGKQTVIHDKMQCDKKSFLTVADTSKKRNLMTVGGHGDNVVDLCGEDNADSKHQYLGKGQTILTKPDTLITSYYRNNSKASKVRSRWVGFDLK
jgi:hypothetical protein